MFKCDMCEDGRIKRYLHVDNGVCYKCNGTGKLTYDPSIRGIEEQAPLWNEQDRLEIEKEQEMIAKAEEENWRIANGFNEWD